MKKFITMAAMAAATLTVFASCNKDVADNGGQKPEDNGTRTVALKMVYPEGTRATGDPVTSADLIDFTSGHILFVDGTTWNVDLHVGIGNTVGNPNVPYADITGTEEVVIGGVPATANYAYLIGNDVASKYYSATGINTNLTGTNFIDLVYDYDLPVINVNSADGGIGNVTVYSVGALNFTSGTTPVDATPYDATVTLALIATAARLEVNQISGNPVTVEEEIAGVPTDVTYTITDFTVEGIYVNNYYPVKSPVGIRTEAMATAYGETLIDEIWNNGNDPLNYSTTGTTQYATGGNAVGLADYINQPAEGAVVVPLTAGDVWAYNVLDGTNQDVPHIIVKLSSVTYITSEDPTPVTLTDRWVTVTGFTNATTGTPISSITGGTVYSLTDLAFDYTNIAPFPEYEAGYDVQVIVEVRPWTVVEVDPEY